MIVWLLATAARATTAEELQARLADVEEDRQLRIWASAPKPSEAELRKVAAGAVVTGLLVSDDGSRAYGAAIVPMPIGVFWSALNDETRHPGYTPIGYSELLAGRACASGRRVLQFLPVPMLADRWWIGVLTINQKLMSASGGAVRELAWKSSVDPAEVTSASGRTMISSAEPIGYTRGAWFLVALDRSSTYVEYYLDTDPGGSIPSSMASAFAARGVRDAIAAIQRFATEGQPSCPID